MTDTQNEAALAVLEDKYEILDKLGEGGMGAIYRVRHRLLSELRVVKLIRPQIDLSDVARDRFIREAKAAARLRHPRIAQLFDFSVEADGSSYIIMEHIDGKDLARLLDEHGKPSFSLGVEILAQGLEAIDVLHSQGFVHRDVAPDNLMLSRDHQGGPQVKLIDLGIVKATASGDSLGGNTAVGAFVGKARYTAPEQFKDGGAGNLGPVSDLYGFGVLGYELLTGVCPIAGKSFADVLSNQLFKPPIAFETSDPEGTVPVPLRELLLRLLAKTAAERPQSAGEVLAALAPYRLGPSGHAQAVREVERLLGDPERETAEDATVLISRAQIDHLVAAGEKEAARNDSSEAETAPGLASRAAEIPSPPPTGSSAPRPRPSAPSRAASVAPPASPSKSSSEGGAVRRAETGSAGGTAPPRRTEPSFDTTINLRSPRKKRSLWQRLLDLFR